VFVALPDRSISQPHFSGTMRYSVVPLPMSETIPNVRHTNVSLRKCKVGPITARYQHGEYVDVETNQTSDDPTRYVQCGLDNSHSKDYKVAYASDSVLVFTGEPGTTHDTLQSVLEKHGLWKESFVPIEVPHGTDKWNVGFKSSTADSRLLSHCQTIMQESVSRDMDYRGW